MVGGGWPPSLLVSTATLPLPIVAEFATMSEAEVFAFADPDNGVMIDRNLIPESGIRWEGDDYETFTFEASELLEGPAPLAVAL